MAKVINIHLQIYKFSGFALTSSAELVVPQRNLEPTRNNKKLQPVSMLRRVLVLLNWLGNLPWRSDRSSGGLPQAGTMQARIPLCNTNQPDS